MLLSLGALRLLLDLAHATFAMSAKFLFARTRDHENAAQVRLHENDVHSLLPLRKCANLTRVAAMFTYNNLKQKAHRKASFS